MSFTALGFTRNSMDNGVEDNNPEDFQEDGVEFTFVGSKFPAAQALALLQNPRNLKVHSHKGKSKWIR